MLIGLVSDTHIRNAGYNVSLSQLTGTELPPEVKKAFHGVDLILHAGDIYTLPVLDELETVAPVLAAEGDDDPFETTNDKRVRPTHTLTVEGVTIWLSHYGVWPEYTQQKPPDVIVFGHAHRDSLEKHDGLIRICPGSPTFPNYQHTLGTVGFLSINSGKVEAEIIQLDGDIGGLSSTKMLR